MISLRSVFVFLTLLVAAYAKSNAEGLAFLAKKEKEEGCVTPK